MLLVIQTRSRSRPIAFVCHGGGAACLNYDLDDRNDTHDKEVKNQCSLLIKKIKVHPLRHDSKVGYRHTMLWDTSHRPRL